MTVANYPEITLKILSVGEQLFAKQGYEATSLRQVTTAAGVNLAAVNYYFGSKEFLFAAIIRQRIQPINQTRLSKLEQLTKEGPVPIEVIIEIMARPIFELCADATNGMHTARLIGRCLSDPLPFMDEIISTEFQPAMSRFGQAIRRHMPSLSPEDFLWRFSFVIGAMHHTLATLHRMKELTRGICQDNDHEGALRRFIQFAVATFTAPAGY